MLSSQRTLQGDDYSVIQKRKPVISDGVQVPERVIMDIKAAFAYFDPENTGRITVSQLKALLQYIAGGVYARKDLEKAMIDIGDSHTVELKDAERIACDVWGDAGYQQETKDMFKLFDRKDKGTTSMEEIRSVLQSRIVVPVLDEDIEELMKLLGVGMDTVITPSDMVK